MSIILVIWIVWTAISVIKFLQLLPYKHRHLTKRQLVIENIILLPMWQIVYTIVGIGWLWRKLK